MVSTSFYTGKISAYLLIIIILHYYLHYFWLIHFVVFYFDSSILWSTLNYRFNYRTLNLLIFFTIFCCFWSFYMHYKSHEIRDNNTVISKIRNTRYKWLLRNFLLIQTSLCIVKRNYNNKRFVKLKPVFKLMAILVQKLLITWSNGISESQTGLSSLPCLFMTVYPQMFLCLWTFWIVLSAKFIFNFSTCKSPRECLTETFFLCISAMFSNF